MPVQTPFGPGLIGPMEDRLWNVVKKLAGQSVTFAEPSRENALVAGSLGSNLKPTGLMWDPGAEALVFGPGGFLLGGVTYDAALVESINGLSNDITLAAGENITLTPSGQTITIAAPAVSKILFASTADKTVTSTITQVSLVGTGVGSMTIPANFFTVGRSVRFTLIGYCKSSANSDLVLKLNFGGNVLSTITVAPWPTTAAANQTFTVEATVTCRATGAGGQFIGNWVATQTPNPSGAGVQYAAPVTAVTNVATTGTIFVDFTYTQAGAGAPSASESITSTNVTLESLG